jgi:uncharacterized protein (UPF0261 family)
MSPVPSIHLLATLDTKGVEAEFLRIVLKERGAACTLIDTGCLGTSPIAADIPAAEVYAAAGASLDALRAAGDRGAAITAAACGATQLIKSRCAAGLVSGVLGLGGSAGTTIATAAMRALPIGVPKLMLSTLASGQVRQYVGDKDITMVNSIVDIAGINRISRPILINAASAMAGMVAHRRSTETHADKPLVAATMFGVTTPCVQRARTVLEAAGYEVLVFHATGSGGQAMESLIGEGLFAGVLDITTTELADELVGGVLTAGPQRLTAAGRCGVPQVVSVGALDMVNFHARETVPERFQSRLLYHHNPTVTLMRTTVEENQQLGHEIGRKVSAAHGPTVVLLPRRGVSALDHAGQPFDDPRAREALFTSLRAAAGKVPVEEIDCHINDAAFAEAAAERLLALMAIGRRS